MQHFHTRRMVEFSAAEMFALVKDVESYPQFVPLCEKVRLRTRRKLREGVEELLTEMRIGIRSLCEDVVTRVICDTTRKEILVEDVAGPFRRMESLWRFYEEPPGADGHKRTTVDFHMRYELKSRVLSLIVGAMLDTAFSKYADAFVRRAHEVFGRR